MTRTSTASSSTEPDAADAEREAAEQATRRQFFRLFGRQTVAGAGNVLAGVAALRQTGQEALDLLTGAPTTPSSPTATLPRRLRPDEPTPAEPAADALRSPYRLDGDELVLLDQRELPERVVTIGCRDASEVAAAIRSGALGAGPVLGQVAAYTLLLALIAAEGKATYARQAALRGAAATLRAARPINRPLCAAIERVLAVADAAAGTSGDDLAAARAEADLIAMEAALDHAAIGQHGARTLAGLRRRADVASDDSSAPLQLLLHGDLGPLAGGMVGPGFAIIQALLADDQSSHAWLTDAAPLLEGRRMAWQLAQLDVPSTTIPDAGAGWLFANRRIDAVLLRAEWVAANSDVVAPLGSTAICQLARAAGVPVFAVASVSMIDANTPDGSAIPTDLLMPARDAAARIEPAADIVPAALLSGIISGSA